MCIRDSISSGLGAMLRTDAAGAEHPLLPPSRERAWDNHFRKVTGATRGSNPYKA